MHRRFFIQLSGCAAAALLFPLTQGCNRRADAWSQPLTFSHIADADTIRLAGDTYRKMYPAENNEEKLRQLLSANSGLPAKPADEIIRKKIAATVQNDFRDGKLLAINGWVLSLTEARQCALFSMLES